MAYSEIIPGLADSAICIWGMAGLCISMYASLARLCAVWITAPRAMPQAHKHYTAGRPDMLSCALVTGLVGRRYWREPGNVHSAFGG